MRVIKQNTASYETLYEALKGVEDNQNSYGKLRGIKIRGVEIEDNSKKKRKKDFFELVTDCEAKIHSLATTDELLELLLDSLATVIPFKEGGIFLFDEVNDKLKSLTNTVSEKSADFINSIYNDQILDWIFENGKPALVPDIVKYTMSGSKHNYYILPIYEGKKNKGVFFLLTPLTRIDDDSKETRLLKVLLGLVFPKILILLQKNALNDVYSELQTYQSKLNNDYKLSAIGELTSGVIENILSPLQIILSYTDMIGENVTPQDMKAVDSIKNQVKKIEQIIGRLSKFSSLNNSPEKIYSCDVNVMVKEYVDVIKSSLYSRNYELLTDLEENVPSLLTHPDYFNQILSNIFRLLKPPKTKGGGILLQSRYINNAINIRIVSTDYIEKLTPDSLRENKNQELRILNNIVKKHEGIIKFDSNKNAGTSVLVKLPLKRKLRK